MKSVIAASILGTFIITALVLTSLNAPAAYACSCVGRTAADYVDMADIILVGKAVRDFKPLPKPFNISADTAIAVERYLKGNGPPLVFINDEESSCGYFWGPFIDERFLVFLRGGSEPYKTGLCSGNAYLGEERGRALLREVESITSLGSPPAGPQISSGSIWQSRPVWFGIGALSALIVIALTASVAILFRYRLRE